MKSKKLTSYRNQVGLVVFLIMLQTMAGCYDPTDGKAGAGAAAAKQEVETAVLDTDLEFLLDGENTDIKWTGSNSAGQTPFGYFYELKGKVVIDNDNGQLKHIEILIDMNGVKAMNESLTKKLKTNGFFEVEKFPEARFVSTTISNEARDSDPKETTDVVEANLKIRDTTQSITIPMTVSVRGQTLKITSEFTINRKDFGVIYSDAAGDAFIRDDVLINMSIESSR